MATCVYLGCEAIATSRLVPQYGKAWLLCGDHIGPAAAAFAKFDNRQMVGAQVEVLR